MKKSFCRRGAALLLLPLLLLPTMSACSPKQPSPSPSPAAALRLGLSVVTTVSATAAESNSTAAAVLVDGDGRITACRLDTAQNTANVSASGVITAPDTFQTKGERGDGYGMKDRSPIGKEWYQQAEAFAAACVGKTADEVLALDSGDGYAADGSDLAAVCTISVSDFAAAVSKAARGAAESGAVAGNRLGLGIVTVLDAADSAADGQSGRFNAYSSFAAACVDSAGKMTAVRVDSVQPTVTFQADGSITTDPGQDLRTKYERGDEYRMKDRSPIGKEWYQQADGLCGVLTGKDIAALAALVNADGYAPAGTDLAAVCTIELTELEAAVRKAVQNAS